MPTPEYYEGKETITKQEDVAEALVRRGIPPARAFDAATAIKYSDRAGEKPAESGDADIGKCVAHLLPSITGMWPWEEG